MSQPVPCPEAAYCPVNSTFPLPCPPGMYCSFASEAPTLCPASHYCPGNTSAPLACPQYRYCPPGSILPFACPRGLRALPDTNAVTRSTFDDACEYCPQGTYNDMPGSPLCRPCPAGYVCLGATGTSAPLDRIADLGYRCEVGYYCPEGSSEQRACPPGTANPAVGATNASACAPCPASTFQEQPGQGSCRSCGATAYSLPGATTCSCYGKSRDYQITDGSCLCRSGYEFYDARGQVSYADSRADCQPIVLAVCQGGTARNLDGTCIPIDSTTVCTYTCPTGVGVFNPRMGLCSCDGLTLIADICNDACRSTAPRMSMDPATGYLRVDLWDAALATRNTTLIPPSALVGWSGDYTCIPGLKRGLDVSQATASGLAANLGAVQRTGEETYADACKLVTIDSTGSGFNGRFGLPAAVIAALATYVEANYTWPTVNTTAGSRRLAAMGGVSASWTSPLRSPHAALIAALAAGSDAAPTTIAAGMLPFGTLTSDASGFIDRRPASVPSVVLAPSAAQSHVRVVDGIVLPAALQHARVLVPPPELAATLDAVHAAAGRRLLSDAAALYARRRQAAQAFKQLRSRLDAVPADAVAHLLNAGSNDARHHWWPAGASLGSILFADRAAASAASGRALQITTVNSTALSTAPGVLQPVVCIELGDGVVFQVSPTYFPVYLKDSLLNSNPSFDFGSFRSLADATAAAAGANTSSFAFTFRQTGLYLFANNFDLSQRMLIAVMAAGTTCPTDASIVPMTPTALIQLGAQRDSGAQLVAINWRIVVGVFVSIALSAIITVVGVSFLQRRSWTGALPSVPFYRRVGTAVPLKPLHDKGGAVQMNMLTDGSGEAVAATVKSGSSTDIVPGTPPANLALSSVSADPDDSAPAVNQHVVVPAVPKSPTAAAIDASSPLSALVPLAAAPATAALVIAGLTQAPSDTGVVSDAELDKYNDDDLDLRLLIERLEGYAGAMRRGFIVQSAEAGALIQEVHTQAESIKRLLSVASHEQAASSSAEIDDARRTAHIARSVAEEMQLRAAHDRRIQELEVQLLENCAALAASVGRGADVLAAGLIVGMKRGGDVLEAAAATGSSTAGGKPAAAAVIPEKLLAVQGAIDQLASAVAEEDTRLQSAVPLWKAAAELGALSDAAAAASLDAGILPAESTPESTLMATLERLSQHESAAAARARELLASLRPLAVGAPQIQHALHAAVALYGPKLKALQDALENREAHHDDGHDDDRHTLAADREPAGGRGHEDLVASDDASDGGRSAGTSRSRSTSSTDASPPPPPPPRRGSLARTTVSRSLTRRRDSAAAADTDDEADHIAKAVDPAAAEAVKLTRAAHSKLRSIFRELQRLLGPLQRSIGAAAAAGAVGAGTSSLQQSRDTLGACVDKIAAANASPGVHTDVEQQLAQLLAALTKALEDSGGEISEADAIASGIIAPPPPPAEAPASAVQAQPNAVNVPAAAEVLAVAQTQSIAAMVASAVGSSGNPASAAASGAGGAAGSASAGGAPAPPSIQAAVAAGIDEQQAAIQARLEAAAAAQAAAMAAEAADRKAAVIAAVESVLATAAALPTAGGSAASSTTVNAVASALVADAEAEAAALAAALADEHRRQQAALAQQLEAQKQHDLAVEARRIQQAVTSQASTAAVAAMTTAVDAQLREFRAAEAEADAEIAAAVAAAGSSGGGDAGTPQEAVEEFGRASQADVRAQLAALRAEHEANLERLATAAATERRRQEASLAKKIADRREARLAALRKRHAEELAAAAGSGAAAVAAATQRHEAELTAAADELAAADRSDIASAEGAAADATSKLEDQRKAIVAAYERDLQAVATKMAVERRRQAAALAQRLAARGARSAGAASVPIAPDAATTAAIEVAAEVQAAETRAAVDAETVAARLRAEHAAETAALEASLAAERARQEGKLAARLLEQQAKRERALRQRQQALAATAAASSQPPASLVAALAAAAAAAEHEQQESDALQRSLAAQEMQVAADAVQVRVKQLELSVEEKLAAVRSEYERDSCTRMEATASERRRQALALERKLQDRKAARLQQLARKQAQERAAMEAQLAEQTAAMAANAVATRGNLLANASAAPSSAAGSSATLAAAIDAAAASASAVAAAQRASHEEENARRLAALARKQEGERKAAEAAAAAEAARETEQRLRDAEAAKRAAIEAKRREMAARLEAAGASVGAEAERLRAEHEAELAAYEASVDEERRRQRERLDKQLAARRAKKERELKRKQDEEMAAEVARQQEELQRLEAEEAAKREKEVVAELLQQQAADGDQVAGAADAIEVVMRKRHAKEAVDLVARQYADRAATLKRVLEDVFERKREAKLQLLESLQAQPGGDAAAAADVPARLAALDARFESEKMAATKAASEELEIKHANEQLALRQRQLDELREAFAELAPEDVLRRHEADEAARAAAELAAFQSSMEQQRAERVARIKREKEEFEARVRAENEAELARLDAEHAAQLDDEKRRTEEQLRVRKERMAREQEDLRKQKLAETSSLDVEARDRIMKEFEEATARTEAKLEAVRAQQQAKLQQKLAERRAKKAAALAAAAADREAALALEAVQREAAAAEAARAAVAAQAEAQRQAVVAAAAAPPATAAPAPAASSSSSSSSSSSRPPLSVIVPAPAGAQPAAAGGVAAAQPTPASTAAAEKAEIAARLARLEELLTSMVEGKVARPAAPSSAPAAAASGVTTQPVPELVAFPEDGMLQPLPLEMLTTRQALRLHVATSLLGSLAPLTTTAPLLRLQGTSLAAASALPLTPAEHLLPPFFYFQQKTLFIRASLLELGGELVTALASALAAIATSPADLPAGVRAADFGAVVATIFDVFTATAHAAAPAAHPPALTPSKSSRSLPSLTTPKTTPSPTSQRRSSLLTPMSTSSSDPALQQRLKRYAAVAESALAATASSRSTSSLPAASAAARRGSTSTLAIAGRLSLPEL